MSKTTNYDILQLDKMQPDKLHRLAGWYGITITGKGKQEIMYAILDAQQKYGETDLEKRLLADDGNKESLEDFKKRKSQVTRPVVFKEKKRHRNDPCSCGSGRKFKHCCEKKIGNEKRHYYAGNGAVEHSNK